MHTTASDRNKLIPLHHNGQVMYLNTDTIIALSWNEKNQATHVRYLDPATYTFVSETPEEIMDLIDDIYCEE
jgi:hypothetical protein